MGTDWEVKAVALWWQRLFPGPLPGTFLEGPSTQSPFLCTPVAWTGRCWLIHPLRGWKPALNYLLCLPGGSGKVASPSQAPLPGQSRVAPTHCPCLGWGWTPGNGERQRGAPGQVRPRMMRAACLPRAALLGKPTPSNRTMSALGLL